MDIRPGSVVLVNVRDPNGRNAKDRPAVVIKILPPGNLLLLVCATTQFDPSNPADDEIPLPYHPKRGVSRSGLTEPCVAKCRWLEVGFPTGKVIKKCGYVRNDFLQALLVRINSLTDSKAGFPRPS